MPTVSNLAWSFGWTSVLPHDQKKKWKNAHKKKKELFGLIDFVIISDDDDDDDDDDYYYYYYYVLNFLGFILTNRVVVVVKSEHDK